MDWTLRCLLWVFLTITSAYKCKQHSENFDYPDCHHSPLPLRRISSRTSYDTAENASRRGQRDDSVVFPGLTSRSSEMYIPEVPEECKTLGFCENVPNYPKELAAKLIAQLGEKKNRLHLETIEEPEIAQRIGPAEDNVELCSSEVKIVKPDAVPDKNGKWYFVLNSKQDPIQGYRVEVCNPAKPICGENIILFNSEYEATCKQKFAVKTITVIDRDGNVSLDKPFQVPTCCSCVATRRARGK